MKQIIRIIGGVYRGKKIHFPAIDGLRPTPDRVRETLFNWLMNDIHDTRCLDAFAGSGALGLEAFSRGASEVVLIEQSSAAHANLKKIIDQFENNNKLKIIKANAINYLKEQQKAFDIIFLDPPFAKNLIPECLALIVKNQLLRKGGLLYTESAQIIEIDMTHWQQIKLKQSGQVVYGLFQKL